MPDLITRSVALPQAVDDALAHLATEEDTTRADLIRAALTMLLHAHGIDLNAKHGVDTSRVGVAHRRDRRQSVAEATRLAFLDWWTEHREQVTTGCEHAEHLETLVEVIADNIDRRGHVYVDPVAELVPGTWQADYAAATAVHAALLALAESGGIDLHRPRRGRPSIRPAPWLTDGNSRS